jgi:hypothetical protein
MVKRPAKSKVLGAVYKIHFVPGEHPRLEGDMGSCEFDDLEMFIKEGQPLQNEQRTVFHEHLEAINENMKVKLRHDQIEQLEVAVMQLIQENPGLVAYLRRKK